VGYKQPLELSMECKFLKHLFQQICLANAPLNHGALSTCIHCTALHCTALHCTALHCTALHCTALHCTALHCTALHCTALHCTALHCTALHCTRLSGLLPTGLPTLLTRCPGLYHSSSYLEHVPSLPGTNRGHLPYYQS
jgi:hypothetical protein